ncbi:MAG: hypothetical protein ACI8R4_002097 [Paracoccaceae bacterium]|jgi:hypothetical protein
MTKRFVSIFAALVILTLGACTEIPTVEQRDIDALALGIENMGPGVDRGEAQRAARIAYTYSLQLAKEYEITDPPLLHNYKVNNGFRKRGLCLHWAEDLQTRLNKENFRTLVMHRAIADPNAIFRIDHSTAVISQRGDTLYDGIVLDPWRYSGVLRWSPTREDTHYNWRPRIDVLSDKYKKRQATRQAAINQ